MVKALKNYNGQMTVKAFTLSAVSCPNVSCFVSAVSSFFCDGILFKVFFFSISPSQIADLLGSNSNDDDNSDDDDSGDSDHSDRSDNGSDIFDPDSK